MKIALIIERFDPAAGGNERSTEQIARRLIARGHAVTILTSHAPKHDDLLPGGTVIAGGGSTKSALGLLRFSRWAQRHLDRDGYDLSLSMTTAVPATIMQPRGGTVRETLARNIARRRTGFKRFTRQLGMILSPKQQMMLMLEQRAFFSLRTRRIVAISRYVADQLFHHYLISLRRIASIPNAAEVEPFTSEQQETWRRKIREPLGLGASDVVFLFPARNPGLKGLDSLLEAMGKIAGDQPRARLIVAGFLGLGPERHARRLGIADRVHFIGPTRQIDALYAACDVTVLPTWYDPASKVVLESLLHGTPAISTLHNGASQWIVSPTGRTPIASPFGDTPEATGTGDPEQPAGRVIRSADDIAGLGRAMSDLCDDDERARCAAAAVHANLSERISMDRHVDALEELMQSLADGAK